MPNKLVEGKKRYSLSLTKATMEKLQEQCVMVGAKTPRSASALITLMVDDFLTQMTTHVMPVVVEAKKVGKGELSEVAFMRMVFEAMNAIGKD